MLVLIVETNKKSDTSAARPIKCDDTKEKSIKIDILSAKKMGAAILTKLTCSLNGQWSLMCAVFICCWTWWKNCNTCFQMNALLGITRCK